MKKRWWSLYFVYCTLCYYHFVSFCHLYSLYSFNFIPCLINRLNSAIFHIVNGFMFYTIDEEEMVVTLLRVLQDGMDWEYIIKHWIESNL